MRLVFVYNADRGLFNAATDTVHKLLSPGTYECRLCQVTYGAFAMRRAWRDYLDGLGLPLVFLHRDEFLSTYPALTELPLPVILTDDGRADAAPLVLLGAAAIDACTNLDALIAATDEALQRRRP
ncbi:MAG: hypothetical protein AAGN64_10170 [Bacteroidota bacterium]